MPFAAPAEVVVELRGEDVLLRFGDREYRVRGLRKNLSDDMLRINLRVMGVNAYGDMALHVDTLELNAARPRMAFVKQAAAELGDQGRDREPRPEQGAVQAGGAARRTDQAGPRAAGAGGQADRARAGGGDGAAARSALAGAHRRGLRPVRRGRRRDQQARRLSGRGVAASGRAAGGDRAVVFPLRAKAR